MKQSIGLIVLNGLGLVVNFFTIVFVASKIDPDVYAVMGVFVAVTGTMRVISGMGFETYSIRNILMWRESKQYEKIEMAVSQALFSRLIAGTALVPLIVLYVYFLSQAKFDGQYFIIFLLFILSGLITAFNNSLSLTLVAFNHYFLSSFIDFVVNTLGKLAALYFFIHYGFNAFLFAIITLPLIAFIILAGINYRWIIIRYLYRVRFLLRNAWINREFWILDYVQYLFKSFDQILVSMLVPPHIFAVFSLAKRVEDVGGICIDNLIDPIMQKIVKFKNNETLFYKHTDFAKKWYCFLVLSSVIFIVIFYLFKNHFIELLNLTKYLHIETFFLFAVLSNFMYLLCKYKYDYLSFFLAPKLVLKFGIIRVMVFILFLFIISYILPNQYLLLYRVMGGAGIFVYLFVIFRDERKVRIVFDDHNEVHAAS